MAKMARSPSKIARRYARALFESYEPQKVESALAALQKLSAAWESNAEMREILQNPGVSLAERMIAVEDITKLASHDDIYLGNFTKLLLENGRITLLPEVVSAFAQLVDILKKRLALEIVSAFELDQAERESIAARVKNDFGGMASIEWRTDSGLIGGLRIKAGDLLLDSSVAGALAELRESLVA
jgi:F-type H+-transporting ATPase subunit delta